MSFVVSAQTVAVDNTFSIDFKKAIKNSRHFEVHTSSYFVQANTNQKKIQIRFKIKSLSRKKEIFDPNKFYLVLETSKKRVRPIDMKHNFAMGSYLGFERLVNEKPIKKKKQWYSYSPEIKDTFFDFKMVGFTDVDNCINFGTKRKPRNKAIYFNHKKLKSNVVDVYFIVSKTINKGKIYYGNTLVADFNVK
jgi:hypothetical protein